MIMRLAMDALVCKFILGRAMSAGSSQVSDCTVTTRQSCARAAPGQSHVG